MGVGSWGGLDRREGEGGLGGGWYVRWGCEGFGGTMFGGVEWDS